jgi:quinol monooxygenase YgiN
MELLFKNMGITSPARTALPCSVTVSIMVHMDSKTVTVVAIMKAKPGMEATLKQEVIALVAPTRKESGCINYDLHQDIEDTGRFIFHENWTSKDHLDKHSNSPHLQAFRTKAANLLAEPVRILIAEKIA